VDCCGPVPLGLAWSGGICSVTSSYLNLAEVVLFAARQPLSPKKILDSAFASGLVPTHLYGSRQDKTLHARLSEDIAELGERSRFFRTAPGIFFLRIFLEDPGIPGAYRARWLAPPRRKELKRDAVLTIDTLGLLKGAKRRTVSIARLREYLHSGRYLYKQWTRGTNAWEDQLPVHSFVVVYRSTHVLTFRCGKFRPESDPLIGLRSVGLGGAVLARDVDILYDSFFGIAGSGINELIYGVGLPRELAERARYQHELRLRLGAISRGKAQHSRALHVVMSYRCPDDFEPAKGALSINDLRWVPAHSPANRLEDFDDTSRLVIRSGFLRRLTTD
jgi:hypothetical protein